MSTTRNNIDHYRITGKMDYRKMANRKLNIADYQPIDGFYDLRAFDIPTKEFIKLWGIQKFLHDVEMQRREGKLHPQMSEIRDFSAKYQAALFQYPVIKPELF